MKTKLATLFFCVSCLLLNAQVKYESIESSKLGESRQLKIQLPRSYNSNEDKSYPLFVVLDGDYLFEVVAGNVDYYSYWEDMPEAIIVGVNQNGFRYDDCMYSQQNSLPIETGASFFEFIGTELVPYIERNYRTANFRLAVGHGETANFINYYLLKSNPLFSGYIAISPDLAPNMIDYLPTQLGKIQSTLFYYLACSDGDTATVQEMASALNLDISLLSNDNLKYKFNNFEEASHYSAPMHAIPKALESIFEVYRPISKHEYKETILKLDGSPVDYLQKKYNTVYELFGVKKQVLINDFRAISAAIEKNETYEYYEALGKLAREEYPSTMLGNYYLARFYEETGESKKAMRTYQTAFTFEEVAGLTKDLMLERAEAIKIDFGY